MKLWTIQPIEVLDIIEQKGEYITDPSKIDMPEFLKAYDWLNIYLNQISPKPDNVQYPVWAWYKFIGKREMPDLSFEDCYAEKGTKCVCFELEIPDNEVLLSDFELWHFVLNNWWLDGALTREDSDIRDKWFYSLTPERQKEIKEKSWTQIFSKEYFENDWIRKGWEIQAVFWKLKKEYIKKTYKFTAQ